MDKPKLIKLGGYCVGELDDMGLTILCRSDTCDGAYIPPSQVWLHNDALIELREFLKDVKPGDDAPF